MKTTTSNTATINSVI